MTLQAVREIIPRDRPLVGHCDETVQTATARMAEQRCGSILVCDGEQLHLPASESSAHGVRVLGTADGPCPRQGPGASVIASAGRDDRWS